MNSLNILMSQNSFSIVSISGICIYLIQCVSLASDSCERHTCWWDFSKALCKCRHRCEKGYFSLHSMRACQPWLTCDNLSDVSTVSTLATGAVKMVILGSWQGYHVAINKLRNERYKDDFIHGLNMIQLFQPNPWVVQLVGFCRQKNIYLTEYHHLGSADHLEDILNFHEFDLNQNGHSEDFYDIQQNDILGPQMNCCFYETIFESQIDRKYSLIEKHLQSSISLCSICESPGIKWMNLSKLCLVWMNSKHSLNINNVDNLQCHSFDRNKIPNSNIHLNCLATRFQLCLDYISILSFLHNSPGGTHIMCDSNDVNKTLSQYLLTDDLRLIVNDLDALPHVNSAAGVTAKCGHHEVTGDFVAPEQLWPFEGRAFNDNDMPGYDEKTDIWKIPQICSTFIGNVPGGISLKLHLFNINTKCKDDDPKNRPSSQEVYKEYDQIWKKLNRNQ